MNYHEHIPVTRPPPPPRGRTTENGKNDYNDSHGQSRAKSSKHEPKLRTSQSANSLLGLSILLNGNRIEYSREYVTTENNYYGFKVSSKYQFYFNILLYIISFPLICFLSLPSPFILRVKPNQSIMIFVQFFCLFS